MLLNLSVYKHKSLLWFLGNSVNMLIVINLISKLKTRQPKTLICESTKPSAGSAE